MGVGVLLGECYHGHFGLGNHGSTLMKVEFKFRI
jgi:hypothetical protein